jgi:hypothetical protein
MPDMTNYRNWRRRQSTEADTEWILEHEREVQELRQQQLARDGKVYDAILKQVVEIIDE